MPNKNIDSFILDNNEHYQVEIFKDTRGQWKDLKKFLLNHHDDLLDFNVKKFFNPNYYTLIYSDFDYFWCVRYFKEKRTLANFINKCIENNGQYNDNKYRDELMKVIAIFYAGKEQPFHIGLVIDYCGGRHSLQNRS